MIEQLNSRKRTAIQFPLKTMLWAIVCCSLIVGAYTLRLRRSLADEELIRTAKQTALGTKRTVFLKEIRQIPNETSVPTTAFRLGNLIFLYDEWKLSDGRVLLVEYSDINGEIFYEGYYLTGEIP